MNGSVWLVLDEKADPTPTCCGCGRPCGPEDEESPGLWVCAACDDNCDE